MLPMLTGPSAGLLFIGADSEQNSGWFFFMQYSGVEMSICTQSKTFQTLLKQLKSYPPNGNHSTNHAQSLPPARPTDAFHPDWP